MPVMQKPIVGTWYVNQTGMMFKVRMLGFSGSRPASVVIEYLEGVTQVITLGDWHTLDVSAHAWIPSLDRTRSVDQPRH